MRIPHGPCRPVVLVPVPMTTAPDDTALLLAAGQGDAAAFETLMDRHHRAIIAFIHRFLGIADRATAEDLAQDVFFSAWRAAPRFRPQAAVRTWLLRIATNRCLNDRRSRRRKPTVPLESDDRAAEAADDPEQTAFRSRALRSAVAALPANQRAAVILKYAHDMPYSEIAAILETTDSAVESLLFRARARLRQTLQPALGSAEVPQETLARGAASV
jgi:RNA polymerase sigma-70 factor (ECF subfamily)